MTRKLVLLLTLVFLNLALNSQTKFIPHQELPTSSGASSGSGIFFSAAMNPTFVTITFEGPSDRWISLGLGTAMYTTDVFIYSCGQFGSIHAVGWRDYFNTSHNGSGVTNDSSQDWTIVSTNTVSGQRTVTATRALNTGDPDDLPITYTASALNLVWAKGATADYTIAYHGSNNRANGISLNWLTQPTASFSAPATTVCAGSAISFSNLSQGGQTTYTWSFGAGSPATSTSTNPTITYLTPGTYSVSLIAANAIGTTTFVQTNYITVTPTIAPTLAISQIFGNNPICAGSPATFSASISNGGSSPAYQWKVNSLNIGSNTSTFSSSSLTGNDAVSCVLSSNFTCATPSVVTSNVITMSVNSTAAASISIAQLFGTNPMCVGSTAGFTATGFNGGANPVYQWQINGQNIGSNFSSMSSTGLVNGDIVSCVLHSSSSCASNTLATSSGITMTVSSVLIPTISTFMTSGSNPMCTGSGATFSASYTNGGTNPVFEWHLNSGVTGGNSSTLSLAGPYNGTLQCWIFPNSSCASSTLVMSSPINMTIYAIPIVTVSPTGNIPLCTGTQSTAVASASENIVWSNGATTQSISINQGGTYSFTQTLNGCSGASQIFTVTSIVQPTANVVTPEYICRDALPFTLQGQPVGGVYSGPGVVGTLFDPSLLTEASSIVLYRVYELFDGSQVCSDTASARIYVSDCSGIKENNLRTSVSVFPNPSKEVLNINSYVEKIKAISIYDLVGKQIFSKTNIATSTVVISLKDYPQGIYLIEIALESQIVKSRIYKTD